MIRGNAVATTLLGGLILVLACTEAQRTKSTEKKAEPGKLEEAQKQLAAETNRFIEVTPAALAPLKTLNDQQQAAVASLVYLDRGVSHGVSGSGKTDREAISRFQKQVASVSPVLAQAVSTPLKGCINESIACASALAKCEPEEKCPESWGPCSQEIECTMRELEKLRRNIDELFGRLKPPRPIPWPE